MAPKGVKLFDFDKSNAHSISNSIFERNYASMSAQTQRTKQPALWLFKEKTNHLFHFSELTPLWQPFEN
jgi:hypothetical protein